MRNKFTIVLSLMIASVFASQPPASGDEKKAEELAPLKVQATRGGGEDSIPASITVFSREEIRKKQYQRVEDILREGLGLDVVRTGPVGSNGTVFMRGAGSSSTLVMIDGIQANLNSTGAFNFANLTTDNIERIEVLRGPQSTLWGADAVGGVINIVTRKGKGDPAHGFAVEGGSYGTFKETATSSGEIKAFDYSLSASRTDTDGFSSANVNGGNTERDGYESTSVSARTGVNFLEDGRAEFIGHFIKSRNEFDTFSFTTGLPADGLNFSRNESFYIALPLRKSAARWWDVKFTPSVSYDQLRSDDPSFGNSVIFNRAYTMDLQNNVELNKFLSVIFGAEYQKLNADLPDQPLSKDIETQGYFLQNVFNYEDRLVVTGGFRHDVNSAFEDKTTYKVEAGYRFKETGTR
ncbi:MAG: TonB-dependent receptor, partial [Nitrospinae bacterium]|nr:TonB-dependent receptor [Nitrospinota bacterium]